MRSRQHSEDTAREIDQEIRRILDEAYTRAREVVRQHRVAIEGLTEALLRFETVSGSEVQRLMEGVTVDKLRPVRKDAPAGPERRVAATPEGRRADAGGTGEGPAGGLLDPTPA
jgi:cell division protease FtsH